MAEPVGVITHYYKKIGVAAITITNGNLRIGDKIGIAGHTTDFEQDITSMQVGHKNISVAEKGMNIGLRVEQPVRIHDKIFKL